jgi:predicted Zn-dependent peptidase
MTRVLTFFSALLVVSVAGAAAQEPQVTRAVLPNGVRVLVRDNPVAGVVAVSLLVRAGSAFETPQNAGISNFLHRVMVRGTTRRSTLEIANAAEDIGGNIDASGDVEYAEVRGTALARHWEPLLELVADVALHPSLPVDAVEIERRLILSQIRTRLDAPFQLAVDTLLEELYGTHPYALPAVGRQESVQRVSREALLNHYRETYQPNRLVLTVSGQVPAARVVRAAEKLFAALPASPMGANAPTAASLAASGVVKPAGTRRVLERAAQQAQILVGFTAPAVRDPDYAAVKVLGAVLGGGMAGRFFVELRDKLGLAYSLGTINPSRPGPTFIVSYMGTAPQSVEPAEAAMLREIERSRVDPPTSEELARAKAYLVGTHAMDRRTNARQAWYLGYFELIGAGYDFPDRYVNLINGVSAADVLAAARRYLERPTVVVLRPR